MTSNAGEVAAFIRSNDSAVFKSKYRTSKFHGSLQKGPDIEIIATPLTYRDHGATASPNGEGTMSLVPIGLRPQSVGSISLKSKNIWDKAVIEPNYWSDAGDNDRKVLLEGMRVCLDIIQQPALTKYFDQNVPKSDDINNFYWPFCATDINKITDEQLLEYMPKTSFTLYHPVTTARMGTNESNSVVNFEDLKVWGVKGLRIVDASIFPEQIAGHPTAAVSNLTGLV